jgi:hypothetical protein
VREREREREKERGKDKGIEDQIKLDMWYNNIF